MKIAEFVPRKRVVWWVVDNYFNFTEDKAEWKGTKVIFELSENDGKTQLRLIETGKGRPNQKEKG